MARTDAARRREAGNAWARWSGQVTHECREIMAGGSRAALLRRQLGDRTARQGYEAKLAACMDGVAATLERRAKRCRKSVIWFLNSNDFIQAAVRGARAGYLPPMGSAASFYFDRVIRPEWEEQWGAKETVTADVVTDGAELFG
jgi:hypothetical protein